MEVEAVEAVQAVLEAQKRIPDDLRRYRFYSKDDVWIYHMVSDDRLCDQCRLYAEIEFWGGDHLRFTFPYHEIIDAELIHANVHPNCRCRLTRLLPAEPMYPLEPPQI